MQQKLQALIFDIDGVITDGRKYTDGTLREFKSISYKDMDAITAFRKEGVLVGCISGEDTAFSRSVATSLDFSCLGEKDKKAALEKFCDGYGIDRKNVCYTGDGKYDLEALHYAGYGACPCDALQEVKTVSDILLNTPGGQGCIAELYTRFHQRADQPTENHIHMQGEVHEYGPDIAATGLIKARLYEHCLTVERLLEDMVLLDTICTVCRTIMDTYQKGGQLLLCGNGGSAADAQHLAAEMVGRFRMERRAYSAEALTANTSILTCLANDYDYKMIFARQVEAKGRIGDVLIGITTSGKSENIFQAFERAKEKEMVTVLMTGKTDGELPILEYTDYAIHIPSSDTARIQEGHILMGHIMCEIIEAGLTKGE